ncbi:hypothetical protein EIG75_19125 [Pseudomonas syringae]|uniref:Uncharacterized protein n=1 Tax=Pseudomonas syringae TaxID=317 RepID=A0A6B2APR3_PSESX|nr:hypothetical protein N032_09690 [Pseudomonas syringae pv. pisi str. PP1]NAO30353.1 hypothetical protein [Pseudomonas syringae]PYD15694.1 hypothetical protein DND62_05935 [Pseudomonas syringae pv. pisi]NAO41354.1 hypothetical protein [Pseudomonas syringae]NAO45881.1 hypothetical protein [Pseudomonas syringae]
MGGPLARGILIAHKRLTRGLSWGTPEEFPFVTLMTVIILIYLAMIRVGQCNTATIGHLRRR